MMRSVGQRVTRRLSWRPSDIIALRRLYPNLDNETIGKRLYRRRTWSAVQNMATKLGLRKSPAFLAGPLCRFQKGVRPWNLGKTGYMGANATSFRKGNRPQTWRPVGSERVNRDGTLERKVRNPGGWKPVKDILWQEAHGRIPRGRFVVHKNRDRGDFRLSNLELVNRAENMRRNTYHRYPKEIARLIQLRGALNRQINRRARHEEQNRGSTQSPVRDLGKGEGRRHAARPGKDGRGNRTGHHQQREGGKRLHQGGGRKPGNRVHHRGRANPGEAGARQKVKDWVVESPTSKRGV